MEHYITILRTQKLIYRVDAHDKSEANEKALMMAESDETPIDILDADNKIDLCISKNEYFLLSKIIDS